MDDSPSVELRVTIPRPWRDDLKEAAAAMGVSMSDLSRLILRAWLRQKNASRETAA